MLSMLYSMLYISKYYVGFIYVNWSFRGNSNVFYQLFSLHAYLSTCSLCSCWSPHCLQRMEFEGLTGAHAREVADHAHLQRTAEAAMSALRYNSVDGTCLILFWNFVLGMICRRPETIRALLLDGPPCDEVLIFVHLHSSESFNVIFLNEEHTFVKGSFMLYSRAFDFNYQILCVPTAFGVFTVGIAASLAQTSAGTQNTWFCCWLPSTGRRWERHRKWSKERCTSGTLIWDSCF